jgi:3-hydroxyisobutyrate dehydrogenase
MAGASDKPQIGFIGLGAMGYPMAARLAGAGYRLRVFDIMPGVPGRFAAEFAAQACGSAAEAARDADVAITMLPSSNQVEAAVLGASGSPGVAGAMHRGAYVIDMSSSEPLRTRRLAQTLAEKGLVLVDAPVSGGVKKAKDGSLTIMFGGSEAALAHCTPILQAMGSTIFRTGDVGNGHAMKALNNFVSAAGLIAAVEALHIGEKFGLDPAVMNRILNVSTGKNNTTEKKVEQFMLSGTFDSGFGLALMAKDIGIAIGLAEQLGVAAQQGHVCYELWRKAAQENKSADHTEMYRLL